jgi:YVTN family beta-propeller protein
MSVSLLLTACLCLALAPLGAATPSLLVLNKGDLTMAIVDAATLKVIGRVPTGPDPHEVEASPDGKYAYVSNYNRGNGAANTITVIDLVAKKQVAPIDLGQSARPHGLHYSGGKLYFTAEGSRVVGRIDPATRRIDWTMNTGQDGTHMINATPDHARAFTTNMGSGSVSILDRSGSGANASDWQVTSVPVGRGAEGFDVSPDGRELWTANAGDATVSIIDVASKKVVHTLPVQFTRANRLKFTPDGKRVLISDLSGHELIVIDAAARKEIKRIEVNGGAAGLLMDPSGARAFLSVGSQNAVAVVDLKTLTVADWIRTGPNPDGLAWVK